MVCQVKPETPVHPCHMPAATPSPQNIKELTAAIRKTWSPQVRASRPVQGRKRVEIMTVSARALWDAPGSYLD
jgi:hypothetical protein